MVTNDPIPDMETLAQFYAQHYRREYKGASKPRKRQVWRNFGRTLRHFRTFADVYGKVRTCIDIGAGSGEFLYLAKASGIATRGVEPNIDYAGYCREDLGLEVRTGRLEDFDFSSDRFDLIRLSHVLEHLPEPVVTLRHLAGMLAEDGVLYVEVPDIADDAQRKLKGRLFHFGHIFNFNPFTLRVAAGLAGLVEAPSTAGRCAGTTGVFFMRAPGVVTFDAGVMAREADRMRQVMADHYANVVPEGRGSRSLLRFGKRMSERLSEVVAGAAFRDNAAIARHFARRLSSDTAQKGMAPAAGVLADEAGRVKVVTQTV
ncbi:class I SAM-dependent methyltransferase [Rhizobium sp. C4]|uniref:class I SAM-dependent methyltransferase n=1 Tax=Rhizobium sp. C4 TaxID=1349800 RepID=UPI001E5C6064|nr:class I SAM-dependent methyltransferase [Rhizobium sp. C4]MCD2171741.1 class I SAM-dependent methyltransferase [Rhizobium sp. C4]